MKGSPTKSRGLTFFINTAPRDVLQSLPGDRRHCAGAQLTSNRAGWTAELRLPTRFVTLIAKYWNGSDLRWYFVGSLLSNFNDAAGWAKNCLDTKGKPAFCEGLSNNGASALLFGVNSSGTANATAARA